MSEIDNSLQNKNLNKNEKQLKEIAKECGLRRII